MCVRVLKTVAWLRGMLSIITNFEITFDRSSKKMATADDPYRGGVRYMFDEEEEDVELAPLSPRDSEDTTESFHTHTTTSYLAFYKPQIERLQRKRTPLRPVNEHQRSYQDDDEESGGYVPDQYLLPGSSRRSSMNHSFSATSTLSGDSLRGLSVLSSQSHLDGERIFTEEGIELGLGSLAGSSALLSPTSVASRNVWTEWKDNVATTVRGVGQDIWAPLARRRLTAAAKRLPQSPRSRNLANLKFLTQQNQEKVNTYKLHGNYDDQDYYDFCIVLKPQEAYAFWATLLDFRPEVLGVAATECMDIEGFGLNPTNTGSESESSGGSSSFSSGHSKDGTEESEARDRLGDIEATPATLRRRMNTSVDQTPRRHNDVDSTMDSRVTTEPRLSMFERATLGSHTTPDTLNQSRFSLWTAGTDPEATPANNSYMRRRWGNPINHVSNISPPVSSLTRGRSSASAIRRPTVHPPPPPPPDVVAPAVSSDRENPNEITIDEIPNETIPRALVARTHFLARFLAELRRGVVVRRHRPNKDPIFVRITSPDGGDTIELSQVSDKEAFMAFREQHVRYNKNRSDNEAKSAVWSLGPEGDDQKQHMSTPNYVAAQLNRDDLTGDIKRILANAAFRDKTKTKNLIHVQPSTHPDPRNADYRGTTSLRGSNTTYMPDRTFSLVYRGVNSLYGKVEVSEAERRWQEGEGAESSFQYFDFETPTIGEYWLLLRGFLFLRRDASVGRFAENRAAGMGSHYNRLELEQREAQSGVTEEQSEVQSEVRGNMFHEPVTMGCIEKLVVKCSKYESTDMDGYASKGAKPPPSDYFLGFSTPGTSIWGRLRLAGLQTERVYSLDPRRVMIKIRCPSHRLMDVAEALRIKLPNIESGSFTQFREDCTHLFESQDDPSETPYIDDPRSFHFRSAVRQSLIDFIISSRIRDSGSELRQNAHLGKMIQCRVPLHMHEKLASIYKVWAFFWKKENWIGRDGCSLSHEFSPSSTQADHQQTSNDSGGAVDAEKFQGAQPRNGDLKFLERFGFCDSFKSVKECFCPRPNYGQDHQPRSEPPSLLYRLIKGSFYLPLDSIEQYFGEKVAFYFAWLQHLSFHLVWLAVAGLVMFAMQVRRGSLDHPFRPFFSSLVMLWTFMVLINWKKRANFLAHRWGTLDYKEQETTRPEFQGDYVKDEITGEWIVTYPKGKRWLKSSISLILTLFFTVGALFLILWVHANRDLALANYLEHKSNSTNVKFSLNFTFMAITTEREFTKTELSRENFADPTFWFILIGMPAILGLCQPLLNLVLMKLSVALNEFENYRTVSEYRSFLIIKVIAFRFVCYFAHLYYYAFSSFGDESAVANGLLRVATGVVMYTTFAHWWQVFLQIEFPILIRKIRMYYRRKRLCEDLSAIEEEEENIEYEARRGADENLKERKTRLINKRLLLDQAQDGIWLEVMLPEHNSFAEYIQAVVLFTYVACFTAVLPITPLIVLFNYLVSLRLEAFKLCKGRRRPLAEKTGGIGVWEHLLHIVAVISVLTNCWLMGFTNSLFIGLGNNKHIGEVGLFAIIVGWEHFMLLIKYVLETSISRLPQSVREALRREQHELEKERNTGLRLQRGRRTQYERESLPGEDRTRGIWRNVPSIRLGRAVADAEHGNPSGSYSRTPLQESDLDSVDLGSPLVYTTNDETLQTPQPGRADEEQGIRTLFSA